MINVLSATMNPSLRRIGLLLAFVSAWALVAHAGHAHFDSSAHVAKNCSVCHAPSVEAGSAPATVDRAKAAEEPLFFARVLLLSTSHPLNTAPRGPPSL